MPATRLGLSIGSRVHYNADMRAICRFFILTSLAITAARAVEVPPLLQRHLNDPHTGFDQIVFAARQPGAGGHWYENFGYYVQDPANKLYRAKGRLGLLNLRTGDVKILLDDPQGSIRDPQVHYDAQKILFSYRPAGSEHFHLYEIDVDSAALRQLTDGPHDDIEPTYLPDGGIMFCSSRCNRWVPCWYSQVAILYRCEADGSRIRPISANIEHDNTPWPLPDGRIIYERWEYVDRSRVGFHHLWTCNPDGTGQMVYYGNMHPETLMIDPRPIPGTNDVVAIFSPGHGKAEHAGAVTVVSPKKGPDDKPSARRISKDKEEDWRDAYALAPDCFLVARKASLYVMDANGDTHELYSLPADLARTGVQLHEPRPLRPRPREPVIPSRVDLADPTGRLVLSDVYEGRNMTGVKRGEIKKLLVLDSLPKPVNYTGKMVPMTFGGTFTLERVLGTVPVEPDGSAYFEVPAMRSLFFVALDADDNSVKRMHSFCTVEPGETMSCVGCHEQRTKTIAVPRPQLMALTRDPDKITPITHVPDVFDFPRDIQPILDRHCLRCHDYDTREGGVILSGDRGPMYSHSFFTLTATAKQISDGRDRLYTNLPPRSVGTSASPLMQKLDGDHHDVRLSPQEIDMIRYWIESGAVYPGTYAALGCGTIGDWPKSQLETADRAWPESPPAEEAITRRCTTCHDKRLPVPKFLSDEMGFVLSNPDFDDPRVRMARHALFNLTRPDQSLILLAPLAKSAGGYAICRAWNADNKDEQTDFAVFPDATDPDYRKILTLIRAGKAHLEKIKRFDMPGFRPLPSYVREMKRYGILPPDLPPDAQIDPYATDQAYWKSLWYEPPTPRVPGTFCHTPTAPNESVAHPNEETLTETQSEKRYQVPLIDPANPYKTTQGNTP